MDWIKREIWPAVQPVLRETQAPDYPYSIGGTVFLAVYKGRAFAITARHVLFPLTPICLFANDWSQRILPLENVFSVPRENEDNDWADFAIIEMDMRKLMRDHEFSLLQLIDLGKVSGDWLGNLGGSDFFVLVIHLSTPKYKYRKNPSLLLALCFKGITRGLLTTLQVYTRLLYRIQTELLISTVSAAGQFFPFYQMQLQPGRFSFVVWQYGDHSVPA